MKAHQGHTTDLILGEIGRRLREYRLHGNLTQKQLGEKAGLDPKSVAKLEKGGDVNMTSLIRILRALGRIDDLNKLLPEPGNPIDPFAVLERERKKRRRVRHPKTKTEKT